MGDVAGNNLAIAMAKANTNARGYTDSDLRSELSRLNGLVLYVGDFRRIQSPPPTQRFESAFGDLPDHVVFRFSVKVRPGEDPIPDRMPYHVFGSVIHRLDAQHFVELQPIAVF